MMVGFGFPSPQMISVRPKIFQKMIETIFLKECIQLMETWFQEMLALELLKEYVTKEKALALLVEQYI